MLWNAFFFLGFCLQEFFYKKNIIFLIILTWGSSCYVCVTSNLLWFNEMFLQIHLYQWNKVIEWSDIANDKIHINVGLWYLIHFSTKSLNKNLYIISYLLLNFFFYNFFISLLRCWVFCFANLSYANKWEVFQMKNNFMSEI